MRSVILILGALLLTHEAHSTSCDKSNAELETFASAASVAVDSPKFVTAGSNDRISVQWTVQPPKLPAGVPVYLIVTADVSSRFEGLGFLTLTKDAPNPSGIAFGSSETRAVLPLHNPTAAANGTIKLKPLDLGDIKIGWALTAKTACGERILRGGNSSAAVRAGKPRLIIQNLYTLETPERINASPGGKYRLHAFADRFRVFDAATGALVLEAPGRDASFSPTGRFLSSYVGGVDRGNFEIFDLDARERIYNGIGEALVWQKGDSFFVAGAGRYQQAVMVQTLLDDPPQSVPTQSGDSDDHCDISFAGATDCHPKAGVLAGFWGCNGCGASWEKVKLAISLDSGVAAVWQRSDEHPDDWDWYSTSLGYATSKEDVPAGNIRTRRVTDAIDKQFEAMIPQEPSGTLAEGTTSHAPPAAWKLWGTREGDSGYSTRQLRGKDDLRKRLIALPNVATGKPSSNTLFDATSPHLHEELANVGVVLSNAEEIPNTVTSITYSKNEDSEIYSTAKRTDAVKQEIQPFLQAVGGTAIDPRPACYSKDLYGQHDSDEKDPLAHRVLTGCSHGLWIFGGDQARYLVAQNLYTYGTNHEDVDSRTFLVAARSGKPLQIVDLTKAFLPDGMPRAEGRNTAFPWPGNIYRLSLAENRYLILTAPGDESAHVFDLETMTPLGKPVPLSDPDVLQSVSLTKDAKFLLQRNADGGLYVSRLADGKALLKGRAMDDEFLLAASDGRYEGTPEGGQFVFLSFAGDHNLNSYRQFDASLRTPGLVRSTLNDQAVAGIKDVAPPPYVKLEIDSEEVESIKAAAIADSSNRLAKLRVLLDGVPVYEKDLEGASQRVTFDISNRSGGKTLTALVTDSLGTVSQAVSRPLHPSSPPTSALRVLAVGINGYNGIDFMQLHAAASDARLFSDAVSRGSGKLFQRTIVQPPIVDDDATPAAIRDALQKLVRSASKGDTVVFFFAGHGVLEPKTGRLWLATEKSSFQSLSTTALPWEDVVDILSQAPTRVLVLLDACHAGAADFDRSRNNDAMVQSLLSGVRSPIVILAASKGRESSIENQNGGLFTSAVVETLSGTSPGQPSLGYIGPRELYYAVKKRVVASSYGQQTPWLARGDLIFDFPILETSLKK